MKINGRIIQCLIFGSLVFMFLALAVKNPFNDKSQIPNLEPFPDTLLYSLPVWNWINGKGMVINSYGLEAVASVPKIYGLVMAPFMKIFMDIRAFYFGNILLALGTVGLIFLTLSRLIDKTKYRYLTISLAVFYLITNFYFYTQPQLFMAENFNLFLVALFFYMLTLPISWKQMLFSVSIIVLTLLVKTSNVPIFGVMLIVLILKLIVEKIWIKKGLRKYTIGLFVLVVSVLTWYVFPRMPSLNSNSFNLNYFWKNFNFYFKVITGGDNRYLWYYNPLYSRDILVLAISGVLVGLWQKKTRVWVLGFLLMLITYLVSISLFRDTEGRHVVFFFPLIVVLAGLMVNSLVRRFGVWVIGLLLVVSLIWPVTNDGVRKIVTIKRQVGLNLKYREDPWNYLAIQEFNKFFAKNDKNVYFGTLLPPFYVDLFDNGNYQYLPITKSQEFPYVLDKKYPLSSMIPYYEELLKSKNKVYVSNYYLNGSQQWKQDYIELMSSFDNKLVWQSPLDNCNVYELNLKIKK